MAPVYIALNFRLCLASASSIEWHFVRVASRLAISESFAQCLCSTLSSCS